MRIQCDWFIVLGQSGDNMANQCEKDATVFIKWETTGEYIARCKEHDANARSPKLRTSITVEEYIVGQVMES